MKKRTCIVIAAVLPALLAAGCGNSYTGSSAYGGSGGSSADGNFIPPTTNWSPEDADETVDSGAYDEDGSLPDFLTETPENNGDFLPGMPEDFTFCSGVGGWSSDMYLYSDGSFIGTYHDSDMGDDGADYPNGTVYICNFSGSFSTPRQVNDYTYTMNLTELTIEDTPADEWIDEGVRYVASDAYGISGGNEFRIYTPGAPVSELPQGFVEWVAMPSAWEYGNYPETLPFYGIYNVSQEQGWFSYEVVSDYKYENEGFIFPDSSERYLSESEVQQLTQDQIRYAINEIYARNGYLFANEEMYAYYSQFSWYHPYTDDMEAVSAGFNAYEKANVELLSKYRN